MRNDRRRVTSEFYEWLCAVDTNDVLCDVADWWNIVYNTGTHARHVGERLNSTNGRHIYS